MALPYLNAKKIASAVVAKQMKSGQVVNEPTEPQDSPMLPVAEEILSAIAMKDSVRLAKALEKLHETGEANEPEESED